MVPGRHLFAKPLDIHPWLSMFSSNVSINKWILFFTCVFNMRVEFICLVFFPPNNGNTASVNIILSLLFSFLKQQIEFHIFPSPKIGILPIGWLSFHTTGPSTEITKFLSVSLLALSINENSIPLSLKMYFNHSWFTCVKRVKRKAGLKIIHVLWLFLSLQGKMISKSPFCPWQVRNAILACRVKSSWIWCPHLGRAHEPQKNQNKMTQHLLS